jgi:hypothetical protein
VNDERDFVSSTEAAPGGSQYVLISFIDPNEPRSLGEVGSDYLQSSFGKSGEIIPFTSPENMAIKVGDKARIEIKKADNGVFRSSRFCTACSNIYLS